MMSSSTSAGLWFWLHIHWAFAALSLFGFLAALLWLNKHASKKDFLNTVWVTLLIGILGTLLTASVAMSGWSQMMNGSGMDWDHDDTDEMMEEMMEEMFE